MLVVVWSFLSLFFETRREGGAGGWVMFVKLFFLTHIWYQIMGSEIVLKPAY